VCKLIVKKNSQFKNALILYFLTITINCNYKLKYISIVVLGIFWGNKLLPIYCYKTFIAIPILIILNKNKDSTQFALFYTYIKLYFMTINKMYINVYILYTLYTFIYIF